ncbi:Sorting nexin-2 [Oopsacas minuta]|uniref:Sorting nexin-2 n=1 Tax=Oopsacas minuta TaxID=111878 RepID=A0AAV7JBD3_9METZ|nr:Sorting nexin-2 [Oopsacas minuta]
MGSKAEETYSKHIHRYNFKFIIEEPEKIGNGINAFLVYIVRYETNLPSFTQSQNSVRRRYSDFLKLFMDLSSRYARFGHIIPTAPEKSLQTLTKVKLGKNLEAINCEVFLEKRRGALERFLNRIGAHPVLCLDSGFKNFLEAEGDLPRTRETAMISKEGIRRMVKDVGDHFPKMGKRSTETDMWFEMKQTQFDNLEMQMKKLARAIDHLVLERQKLCDACFTFSKDLTVLGQVETKSEICVSIQALSDLEFKMGEFNQQQWKLEFLLLGELIKDYLGLISSIKKCFVERARIFKSWQRLQGALILSREKEGKFQVQGKPEKLIIIQAEITSISQQALENEDLYDRISENIAEEIENFESQKSVDFKATIKRYLQCLLDQQEQIVKCWQGFQPALLRMM